MARGLFLAFEGTERAGKSTAIATLRKYLSEQHSREVVVVRTPGGTPIGQKLRQIVVGEDHVEMSRGVNALIFAADWRHTLETVIIPALIRGAVVIADRFNLSMLVYQDCELAHDLFQLNNELRVPDIAFIMTTDFDTMVRRRDADLAETNARDFISQTEHDRLKDLYNEHVAANPRYRTIDASGSPDASYLAIRKIVDMYL